MKAIHLKSSVLFVFCMLFASVSNSYAAMIKQVWVGNKSGVEAAGIDVQHFSPALETKGISPPRQAFPSEAFNMVAGLGTTTLNFAGGPLLPAGTSDSYLVKIAGAVGRRGVIIRSARAKDADGVVLPSNFAGFTNSEYLFQEGGTWQLGMFNALGENTAMSVDLLEVWTGLPNSAFTLDAFADAANTTAPTQVVSSLNVLSGEEFTLSLGDLAEDTYVLARGTNVTLTDEFGSTNFGNGYFAIQVPEPGTLSLLIFVGLPMLLRRR
ncbi:MAG: hypothetical protein AB7N71_05375 [Phycisphaerae bacterium]